MASTFLELTNKLLKRFNEVEISQADFSSVKGIHATAKLIINDSLREINSEHFKWPFNAVEHSETLSQGTYEYAWPSNFKAVDWRSFQIQKDDSLNVQSTTLKQIDRNDWYRLYHDTDDDAGSDGTGVPRYVYNGHGQNFGVSPSPDKAYTLEYKYYKNFTELSNYDDETDIPSEFDHVIIYCAMKHMNLFLDNVENAGYVDTRLYQPALRAMRTILINDDFKMSDTRIPGNHTNG